ncbi:hypothetical protein SAMN04488104_100264 [Algoriphagus faecimaris]|uniref:Uncharacterized protein n=1 Tax=Algoriphagus faecimaris TaxID=686796 RepID=A0A1G6MVH6_9BACT|nr:hypothetical protein [Algoriphagus faecimaris]SDC58965.1 hypothetical protein SAMN04488104_100264 [Algoriphagus faecimaris]
MKILGLIALYYLSLFVIGWLLLDAEFKSCRVEDRFSSVDLLRKDALLILEKFQLESFSDSLWPLPSWLQRPIDIVRYPDVPPINFLPNGD